MKCHALDKNKLPKLPENFPQAVRNKAIEIANALFKKGTMEEGRIIAIAITNAKKWAKNRGLKVKKLPKRL